MILFLLFFSEKCLSTLALWVGFFFPLFKFCFAVSLVEFKAYRRTTKLLDLAESLTLRCFIYRLVLFDSFPTGEARLLLWNVSFTFYRGLYTWVPSVDKAPCRYNLDPSERSIKDRDKFLFFSSWDNILLRLNKHKTYRLKFLYRKTLWLL